MEISWTCELAYRSRPPMGAKMMPMEKKRGRTVFGVRIGLVCGQHRGFAQWEGSPIVDDLLPCLQPLLSKRSVCWLIRPSATCPARYANHLKFHSRPSCPSSARPRECGSSSLEGVRGLIRVAIAVAQGAGGGAGAPGGTHSLACGSSSCRLTCYRNPGKRWSRYGRL